MKKLIVALCLLLPSFAMAQDVPPEQGTQDMTFTQPAQDVTPEQITRNYAKCEASPHHAPNIMPLSAAINAQPIWDDADYAQACPAIWARWKAHRDDLNSQQTKADLKAFADKLK